MADPEAGEKPAAPPRKPRPASEEMDWTRENGSLYVYLVCMMLLFFGTLRIAFFPAGRQRQQPLPALVSTLPSDRGFSGPEGDYQATLEALKRDVAAAPGSKLVFLGDSITESLRGECGRPGCSDEIPAVWAAEFAPHQALALGVSGDRTENLLWRLEQGETAGLAPKLTVVEIGTNNLAFGHSAEATAYGVQAVVRSVREKLPGSRVAVQLLLPRSKDRGDFTPWHDVDVVNEMLWEALRGTPGVSIVDCTKPFLKDGLVDEALMPDGLHPNADGMRAWAKCLNKVFKRFLDPLPGGPTSPIALDLGAVA